MQQRFIGNSALCIALFILSLLPGCSTYEEGEPIESLHRARTFLRAKNYYATTSLLNTLDDGSEKSVDYYRMQGVSFFKLDDYHNAALSLEKAEPKSLMLQIYIAYLYLLLGNAEKARALADAIEHRYGSTPEGFLLKGNISLKKHIYYEAEQHFHRALALDNSYVKAYISLGNTYMLQHHFLKAEENYLKALFLSKNDPSPYIALAYYYTAQRRYDDAEYILKTAIGKFPEDLDLSIILSNLYTKVGKNMEALEILDEASVTFPQLASLKIRVIRQYLYLNRLEDAYPLIHDFLNKNGEDYYGLILLSEFYLRKNDYEQALLNLDKVLRKNDNSYIANYYLGVIYLVRNQLRLSMKFLEKSIQNYPSFANAHLLLANAYIVQKKYSLSSEHAKLVLQLDPGNATAHLLNGISLYIEGYLNEAKYEFEAADILNTDNVTDFFLQALVALEQQNTGDVSKFLSRLDFRQAERVFLETEILKLMIINKEEVEKHLQTYIASAPNYLNFILLGNYYREMQDIPKAEEYFRKALAVSEDIVIPYYQLAELEAVKGNKSSAIAYLQKAVDTNPHFIKSYQALGSLYEGEKDYEKAKLTYEKGLKYASEDTTLLNNLAWVMLVHFDDKPSAYIHIRKAVSLAPDDADIQDTLAWWYYLTNNYQQSVALLKKIVAAHPDNPFYQYHLGLVALQSGDQAMALAHLKKALKLGIDDEYKVQVLELVK